MSTRKDLPNPNAPNFLQRVREEIHALLGKTGSARDRALTLADAINSGVIGVGPGGGLIPGPGVGDDYEPDLTPPPTPGSFTASPAISHILIEQEQPAYTQGHGHLRTRVYGATHMEGDPLPVFADAVEVGQFEGTIWALASNPSTTWRLWIKWESRDGELSATPAGGTNGVVATTGQDVSRLVLAMTGPGNPFKVVTSQTTLPDGSVVPVGTYTADAYIHNGQITNAKIANLAVDDAKIANLSVSKLTAGSIAVGQYAQNTGYVAGSSGWRINGDGTAEFSGVVVRGTVYASAGLIGGNKITETAIESPTASGFDSGSGFHLGSDGRARFGNPTGARIQWTGSAVEIYNSQNQLTLASGEPTFGRSANLLRNSDLPLNANYWAAGYNQSNVQDVSVSRNLAGPDWKPVAGNTIGITRSGTPTGVWDLGNAYHIPVVPGRRYEASGKLARHRCNADIGVVFGDVNGNYITEFHSQSATGNGGKSLSSYSHVAVFCTAPENAAYAYYIVRSYATGEGNPYTWLTEGYFGEAGAAQTQPSPWSPANFTEQINASNVSTYIASGAIGNAYIGNFIASNNFNGTVDANGVVVSNGTTGWVIGKGGKAVFQDAVVRGDVQATSLNAATGTFSGSLTANAVNAVNTINLAGNAVTTQASAEGNGSCATSITIPNGTAGTIVAICTKDYFYMGTSGNNSTLSLTIAGNTKSVLVRDQSYLSPNATFYYYRPVVTYVHILQGLPSGTHTISASMSNGSDPIRLAVFSAWR